MLIVCVLFLADSLRVDVSGNVSGSTVKKQISQHESKLPLVELDEVNVNLTQDKSQINSPRRKFDEKPIFKKVKELALKLADEDSVTDSGDKLFKTEKKIEDIIESFSFTDLVALVAAFGEQELPDVITDHWEIECQELFDTKASFMRETQTAILMMFDRQTNITVRRNILLIGTYLLSETDNLYVYEYQNRLIGHFPKDDKKLIFLETLNPETHKMFLKEFLHFNDSACRDTIRKTFANSADESDLPVLRSIFGTNTAETDAVIEQSIKYLSTKSGDITIQE